MASNPLKKLFDAEPKSPLYVAINRVLVKNDPHLMSMMKQASSKMCLATALTPGYKGFDLMKQLGACPMGMRWDAQSDMSSTLSHIWIDQFTYWDNWRDHEIFHETFEDIVVDACGKCGEVLLEGPDEPVYRIVHSDLPKLVSKTQMLKRGFENDGNTDGYAINSYETVTVMAQHVIKPGAEQEFEEGEIEVMNGLKETSGVLGFQILKRIGFCSLGAGHATVGSMVEDMKDSSGSKLKSTTDIWDGYTMPAQYLVMVEFESLQAAQTGMPHVNVKPELLFVHGPKVFDNCLSLPSVYISNSMFTEQTYREVLNGTKGKK